MKKYRPYSKFPDDIIGKVVKDNCGNVTMVYHMPNHKELICTTIKQYNTLEAFNQLTFLDSTPVGEEYEEAIELEHDKVYCVRMMGGYRWVARHFKCRRGNINWFHANGSSSITNENNGESLYKHIAEYDHSLINATKEPKEYLVKQD